MIGFARSAGSGMMAVAALSFATPAAGQRQVDLPRPTWEYQCLHIPARGKGPALARQIEAEANQRGEGWQLASFTLVGTDLIICFGRSQVVVNTEVTRLPDGARRPELSGNWSELDSNEAASKIIADCFTNPTWLGAKKSSLRVARVINKTDEHLDAQSIIAQVEKAIIATKKLRVLASRSSDGEPSPSGDAADFLLELQILSLVDQVEGVRIKHYSVSAQVIAATSGQKVCIANAEITKSITQAPATW